MWLLGNLSSLKIVSFEHLFFSVAKKRVNSFSKVLRTELTSPIAKSTSLGPVLHAATISVAMVSEKRYC